MDVTGSLKVYRYSSNMHELQLMIQCCLMNGYCPYTTTETYLLYTIIVLMFIMVVDKIA